MILLLHCLDCLDAALEIKRVEKKTNNTNPMTGCHEGKDCYEALGVLPAYVNGRSRP